MFPPRSERSLLSKSDEHNGHTVVFISGEDRKQRWTSSRAHAPQQS